MPSRPSWAWARRIKPEAKVLGPGAREGRAGEGLVIPEDGTAQEPGLLAGEHEDGGGRSGRFQVGALFRREGSEGILVAEEIGKPRGTRAGIEPGQPPRDMV